MVEQPRVNESLVDRVLEKRKFIRTRLPSGRHTVVPITARDHLKTDKMRYIELKLGECIEVIIMSDSLRGLEKKLGINKATLSKWRERLGLPAKVE